MKLNGYKGTITPGQGWLYKDGKTDYQLLIPAQATESERFAAEELTWIFSLAGVTVETVTDLEISDISLISYPEKFKGLPEGMVDIICTKSPWSK